uniref:Claudin a n=1 Tax=Astatotilapia calliptera TaxID=8154 RepID=A0A3P8QFD1_ASTCA
MASAGFQMLGTALCIIGWIGVIVICALPQWKVTAFIGQNIVTAQTTWEGIWMTCVVQSTGQMQCKVYDSMLALSSDLQAARALTIIAILLGVIGILLAMAGGKCTNSNTIIQEFYSPMLIASQKKELGASLFIGWGAGGLLIIGGAFLCANCPPKDNYSAKYSAPRSSAPPRD